MKKAAFIKKVLSLILALSLLFIFEACGNGGAVPSTAGTEPSSETETSGEKEEAFAKPENYATVLTVTINPQFRLYLDADGIVLAVESVNKDAEEVKEELSFENDNYETVIEKIVTKSEEKGYVKKDAVINVEITETKDTTVNTVEILDKITVTVNQTATKLEVTVEIKTEDNSAVMDQPTEGATESTEQPSTEAPVPTQCNHTYKNATCTAPKTCSKCGATEGSALGHKWTNATCTTPKTCSVCKAINGNALGHTWTAATCTAPKTCSTCKATEGSAADHTWKNATCIAPKTCTKCGATEGLSATHIFESGKCIFCQKDDIVELDINLLQNETYVSHELIGDNELIEYTISFDLIENNAIIFSMGEYYYFAEPDFDTTNASSVKYDGKDFYGGDGGFGGYWLIAKEKTLEVFDEWNAWLYTDSQSVATYVMQHDGKLRLIESKVNHIPSLYESKR